MKKTFSSLLILLILHCLSKTIRKIISMKYWGWLKFIQQYAHCTLKVDAPTECTIVFKIEQGLCWCL